MVARWCDTKAGDISYKRILYGYWCSEGVTQCHKIFYLFLYPLTCVLRALLCYCMLQILTSLYKPSMLLYSIFVLQSDISTDCLFFKRHLYRLSVLQTTSLLIVCSSNDIFIDFLFFKQHLYRLSVLQTTSLSIVFLQTTSSSIVCSWHLYRWSAFQTTSLSIVCSSNDHPIPMLVLHQNGDSTQCLFYKTQCMFYKMLCRDKTIF